MRALQKDPSARFQTVREFARALDASAGADAKTVAMPRPPRAPQGAPTMSRTAVNPALGHGQGQPQAAAARPAGKDFAGAATAVRPLPAAPARRKLPRLSRGAAAIALTLCAVVAGVAVLMPRDGATRGAAPPCRRSNPSPRRWQPRSNAWRPCRRRPLPRLCGDEPTQPTQPPAQETMAPRTLTIVPVGSDGHFKPGERVRLQVIAEPRCARLLLSAGRDTAHRALLSEPLPQERPGDGGRAAGDPGPDALRDPGEHAQRDGDDCLLRERARPLDQLPSEVLGTDFAKLPAHLARPGAKRLCARWRRQAGRSQLPGSSSTRSSSCRAP